MEYEVIYNPGKRVKHTYVYKNDDAVVFYCYGNATILVHNYHHRILNTGGRPTHTKKHQVRNYSQRLQPKG